MPLANAGRCAESPRRTSKNGQPCEACHAMFGASSERATPREYSGQGERSTRRSGSTANPISNPAAGSTIEYFAYAPAATATASSIHQRLACASGARTMRIAMYIASVQKNGSNDVVVSVFPSSKYAGVRSVATPASSLRESSPAELAGKPACQVDRRRGRENRQCAQRDERVAGGRGEPRRHRDQRRLIHVSPRQMFRACDEVEFVAEVAVARRRQGMQQ